jgi:hypothetical protein
MVQEDVVPTIPAPSTGAVKLDEALSMIERAYPTRVGSVRRIHPVFKNCYRINFHDPNNNYAVGDSYFVSVSRDGVTTEK